MIQQLISQALSFMHFFPNFDQRKFNKRPHGFRIFLFVIRLQRFIINIPIFVIKDQRRQILDL